MYVLFPCMLIPASIDLMSYLGRVAPVGDRITATAVWPLMPIAPGARSSPNSPWFICYVVIQLNANLCGNMHSIK